MHSTGYGALTFMLDLNIKINAPERSSRHSSSFWINKHQGVVMSEEGNPFLRHARSMSFGTPEKTSLPEVKAEKEEKPSPSASPSPKKLCTSSEKFLKGLPGDTSAMRESLALLKVAVFKMVGSTGFELGP